MKKYCKKLSVVLFLVLVITLLLFTSRELFTFESLKKNSEELLSYVDKHYLVSLLLFGLAFISTAFFVPGALVLTLSGGLLFGGVAGALYATLFSTAGAVLAFFSSRYLIGNWVQKHYRRQLGRFNEEISRRGNNYLLVLRIIPVMPFFVVNYLAGLTRISTARFAATTFLGMLPGAVIYSMAGRQLATIENPQDILSGNVILLLLLLVMFALLPVLYELMQRFLQGRR